MVLVEDPEVARELALGLAHGTEALENTGLDNHPWMRETLWKSRSPIEKFQHTVGTKYLRLDKLKRVRGTA